MTWPLPENIVSARAAVAASTGQNLGEERAEESPWYLESAEERFGARYEFTDAGNSQRFTEDHLDKLIYVRDLGWFEWTGHRWKFLGTKHLAAVKFAKQTARRIRREVSNIKVEDDSKAELEAQIAVVKWAQRSASDAGLASMVKLAAAGEVTGPSLAQEVERLDQNPDILNTRSGVVDLQTGELRPNDREEYCTRITRAAYKPDADMKPWLRLLKWVLPNASVRSDFQKVCGVGATGHSPKTLPVLVGPTDTGKTVVTEAISHALGSYAAVAMEGTFTNAPSDKALYDLAKLRGKRWVVFSETRSGAGLATERVKRATGGEVIAARAPAGMPFEYLPAWLLVCPTNHAPVIPSFEDAMYERIRAYPFEVNVVDKLKAKGIQKQDSYGTIFARRHGEAILRWLVEGAQAYYREGLGTQPEPMLVRRDEWKARDDLVGRWVEERTEPASGAHVPFPRTYGDFKEWAKANGEEVALRDFPAQKFHAEMDQHYPRSKKKVKGVAQRLKMRLISPSVDRFSLPG